MEYLIVGVLFGVWATWITCNVLASKRDHANVLEELDYLFDEMDEVCELILEEDEDDTAISGD